jgi:D-alanyl-D-alanine carboxypeptidase
MVAVLAACSSAPIDTLASPTPTALATLTQAPSAAPTTSVPTSGTPTPSATVGPSPTPSVVTGTYATRLAGQLRDVLNSRRTSMNIPGMTAAIIFPDGSTWSDASGQAEVSPARRALVSTPFVAGSITKTFVAATILQLAEEGALSLDDPLSDWLPDYPRADDITLRHLLSHYSGVFNLFDSPDYTRLVIREGKGHKWTPQEVLDKLGGDPYCAPGGCYHYSNTGFVLLGMVIEAETGKSFGQVLKERFWTPLGMSATYFQGDGAPPSSSARGYVPTSSGNKAVSDGTNYRPTKSEATVVYAAGGIVSTCKNLARWADALYGGDVLSDESLALLTGYVSHPDGAYGLGTRTRTYQGNRMFGHTGALRGFNAAMWHLTSLDVTVVVMTNRTRIDANKITDAFLSVVVPAVQ